jgi:type II secretory pathway pseudopilin PulG
MGCSHRARRPATGHRPLATGFTVTELLIVIGIIVLVIALAVPAFNVITGSKSVESANNQISAFLARARNEAIGLQELRGIAFYPDPAQGGRYVVVLVRQATFQSPGGVGTVYKAGDYVSRVFGTTTNYYVCVRDTSVAPASLDWVQTDTYAIDVIPDTESISLPPGVGVQAICDSKITPPVARASDAYLRCGAILFNSAGQLVSQRFSIACGGVLGQRMGIYTSGATQNYGVPPGGVGQVPGSVYAAESSLGFVLFDREAFKAQSFPTAENDYSVPTPNPTSDLSMTKPNNYNQELLEEKWLDANSTPVLINRYTGALVKGG